MCVFRICVEFHYTEHVVPDSKFHGANMGHTWVLSAPDGLHFGPMNLAIRGSMKLWLIGWLKTAIRVNFFIFFYNNQHYLRVNQV